MCWPLLQRLAGAGISTLPFATVKGFYAMEAALALSASPTEINTLEVSVVGGFWLGVWDRAGVSTRVL